MVQCTLSVVMHTQTHFRPEARENYSTKARSNGNEELGVQPYLYEPKTNTEGNANIRKS